MISHAFHVNDIPNKMYLTQHLVSYTPTFDIGTKTKKIGTLYRRAFSVPLTYDFYDNSKHLLTTTKAKFFSNGYSFDIYDDQNNLLGSIEEQMFTFSHGFILYSPHSVKLAQAGMNFWGTSLSIYDAFGGRLIAIMSRPFFRIKNEWSIEIKNKALLKLINIDPDFFMIILSLQGEREYLSKRSNKKIHDLSQIENEKNQKKIEALMQDMKLNDVPLMDAGSIDILAAKLEKDYQHQLSDPYEISVGFNSYAKITDFVDYCLSVAQSSEIVLSDKMTILYLLKQRFSSGSLANIS